MRALRCANLSVAFLLELGLLVGFAVWGWSIGPSTETRVLIAAAIPAAAVAVWSVFLAPRSRRRLRRPGLVVVKTTLFAVASIGLAGSGHGADGAVLFGAFTVNLALALAWRQEDVAGVSTPT